MGDRRKKRIIPLKEISEQLEAIHDALEPHLHEILRDEDGACLDHADGCQQWELETAQRMVRLAAREIYIVGMQQLEREAQASSAGPH